MLVVSDFGFWVFCFCFVFCALYVGILLRTSLGCCFVFSNLRICREGEGEGEATFISVSLGAIELVAFSFWLLAGIWEWSCSFALASFRA